MAQAVSSPCRSRVLQCFKTLHRTRKQVFKDDHQALNAGRERINEEFRKHKEEKDPSRVDELIKAGYEASDYLRTMVVQARLDTDKGTYKVQITSDTRREDNAAFKGGDTCQNFKEKPRRSIKKNTDS